MPTVLRRVALVAGLVCGLIGARPLAQTTSSTLTLGLLERYVEALRVDFGMPGLSAVVIEDGRVWERGFGLADVAGNIPASPTTPYPLAGLTQAFGSALMLEHCIDSGRARLSDRVVRWTPFVDPIATLGQVATHSTTSGAYAYDPARFDVLTQVAAECANDEFDTLLASQVFDRLAMTDSVPGLDAVQPARRTRFSPGQISRYESALRRLATPYRVVGRAAPVKSDYREPGVSASGGVISTARDLAQFDTALGDSVLLSAEAAAAAWTPAPGRLYGMGWFAQTYSGQRVVWQFGVVPDAYSALVVKLPSRRLTMILLANSDHLANTLNPQTPDVTQSVFARTFLRLFVS